MNTKIFVAAMACAVLAASCADNGKTSGKAASCGITSPVVEVIMARRSIRAYRQVPVSRDTMKVILECGINAPNAMNRQNWEVRVVDSAESIARVTEAFKAGNPRMAEQPGFVNMFRNAPTVAFIANRSDAGMSQIDCGLLGENMILAAQSLGIGSCCLGGPVQFLKTPEGKFFLDELNFSEGYELLYAIAFGYPDEAPDAKPREAAKVRFAD